MGIDWKGQHAKLTANNARWSMEEISTVAQDGKQRQMTCLPLRKLHGWMAGIHANKIIKADKAKQACVREAIIAYQNECDDELWRHWSSQYSQSESVPKNYPFPAEARVLLTYRNGKDECCPISLTSTVVDLGNAEAIKTLVAFCLPADQVLLMLRLVSERAATELGRQKLVAI